VSKFISVSSEVVQKAHGQAGRAGENPPQIQWFQGQSTEEKLERAIDVVTTARKLLRTTETKLSDPKDKHVREWASHYFDTDDVMLKADLDRIGYVIRMTKTGLETDANLRLKLGREEESLGRRAGVTMKTGTVNVSKLGTVKPWGDQHLRVMNLRTDNAVHYGAIHISESRLNEELGPKSLIHEATHRYAGTHDYWIWEDSGLKIDGVSPVKRGDARWKLCSLLNADSYAWFIYMVANGY